ncbi:MAG: hypothetical protein GWN54_16180, partial [Gammaproteobacteria bacterium]|nr:hypothetical protein [Gammaproteobacteria bacterium]
MLPTRRGRPESQTVNRGLGILYTVLGTLALVALFLSLAWPSNPVVERLAPGFATELMGILVTLVFVQRFLERQERTRRLRTSVGALRRGARALTEMATVWGGLVKGAARADFDRRPDSLDDLFAPHWTDSLDEIDAAALGETAGRDGAAFLDTALDGL